MKHFGYLLLAALLCTITPSPAQVADTIDILHYDLKLDLGHSANRRLVGHASISALMLQNSHSTTLDLLAATVDSVAVDGIPYDSSRYSYDGRLLTLALPETHAGDSLAIEVFYSSQGYVEPYDWGGFHFDNSIYYNLGIAFDDYPHNYGRAWFPCRDNFTDKASFRLEVTGPAHWTALCGGTRESVCLNADSSETSVWTIDNPTPTYLVSVAVAPFHVLQRQYQGLYDTYPALIGYRTQDSASVTRAFDILEEVVPMYERCFGPYRWGRMGYVGTPKGSMEHVANIGLANSCMNGMDEYCQSVICHELSHSWFGNLVTCATSGDMWFNEGGATFCEEVAMEAAFGKEHSDAYYLENLESVLRSAHIADDGYKPLYGQTPQYTYGKTVYNKGAAVWHSLRGYMGDSLFYASLRTLFERNAFAAMDSRQVRDSLALYSGTDLTDFFQFHVFQKGFVDYTLDSMATTESNGHYSVTLKVRQKLAGYDDATDDPLPVRSNRVPVTFFRGCQPIAKRVMTFDGTSGYQTFTLPSQPDFAVLDYDRELSDAVTDYSLLVTEKGTTELPLAHFQAKVTKADDTAFIHVAHHWAKPDGEFDQPEIANHGFLRMANRYWTVGGYKPEGVKITGYFRLGKSAAEYPYLDRGFFDRSATGDSVELLYRKDCHQRWRIVKTLPPSTSRRSAQWLFLQNMQLGEYTLAVVDSSLLSVARPAESEKSLSIAVYPNPTHGSCTIDVAGTEGPFVLYVYDTAGKLVLRRQVDNHQTLRPQLGNGAYVFYLETLDGKPLGSQKVTFNLL